MKCPVKGPLFFSSLYPTCLYGSVYKRILSSPLIFSMGEKSDSLQLPKGLTVGTEPEQIPFVFLALRGPAIVDCGASCKIQPSWGLWVKPLQITLSLFGIWYCLSSPVTHPNLLGMTSIFRSFYHSDVLQMQTFLGLSENKREAEKPCPGPVQQGGSAQEASPRGGWEVLLNSFLSHTFTWDSSWLSFLTWNPHLRACVAKTSSQPACSVLSSLSPHHTSSSAPWSARCSVPPTPHPGQALFPLSFLVLP